MDPLGWGLSIEVAIVGSAEAEEEGKQPPKGHWAPLCWGWWRGGHGREGGMLAEE